MPDISLYSYNTAVAAETDRIVIDDGERTELASVGQLLDLRTRFGTAAAFTASNPVLPLGCVGLETDTRRHKIGDGTAAWNSLVYASSYIITSTWAARPSPSVGEAGQLASFGATFGRTAPLFEWTGSIWVPKGPVVLGQSLQASTPVSVTGSTSELLFNDSPITIPGGLLQPGGELRIVTYTGFTGVAGGKTVRHKLAAWSASPDISGSEVGGRACAAGVLSYAHETCLWTIRITPDFLHSFHNQFGGDWRSDSTNASSSGNLTLDTSTDIQAKVTIQLANAGDAAVLRRHSVVYTPPRI